MKTSIKGWGYISAILHYMELTQKVMPKTIIEPHCIYRGISKRYFTSSSHFENEESYNEKYNDVKKLLKENLESADYLKALYDCPKSLFPEYIRSSAAVRLKKIEHRTYNDYINYHQSLILDAKNRFPDKYLRLADIEILADIQHKGGATCMVDFSNNILTSLWFAVQNDFDDIGYLFCYDTHKDMIERDHLSYLGQKNEGRKIHELLYDTTKSANYNGDSIYKFWLWKPSNLNTRIARQDSIFVFGLEPFNISDHNVIVIPIPPHWKCPILHTLKTFFGITAESVYCDDYGLASSNSKTVPYNKTIETIFYPEISNVVKTNNLFNFAGFQNGMLCLLNEQYDVALTYFMGYEASSHSWLSSALKEANNTLGIDDGDIIDVELHFSKALCYKNRGERDYAICEYEIALDSYSDKRKLGVTHMRNKLYKILNDLIDLLYDKEDYAKIEGIIDGYLDRFLNDGNQLTGFIQTMKNDVALLKMLKERVFNPECIDTHPSCEPFYEMLNTYFRLIACIGADLTDEICRLREALEESYEKITKTISPQENQHYKTKWNLNDIVNAINKYYADNQTKLTVFSKETYELKRHIDLVNAKHSIANY